MTLKNRIKCAASIDAAGAVILAAAKPGFRALPVGWAAVAGEYPYLLEDDINLNNWEIGLVRVTGTTQDIFNSKNRLILDSSGGTGFANGATGLTFSQCASASNVWAGGMATMGNTGIDGPLARGTNVAAGPNAHANAVFTYGC